MGFNWVFKGLSKNPKFSTRLSKYPKMKCKENPSGWYSLAFFFFFLQTSRQTDRYGESSESLSVIVLRKRLKFPYPCLTVCFFVVTTKACKTFLADNLHLEPWGWQFVFIILTICSLSLSLCLSLCLSVSLSSDWKYVQELQNLTPWCLSRDTQPLYILSTSHCASWDTTFLFRFLKFCYTA